VGTRIGGIEMEEITEIELQAEVYKVIRANTDKKPKKILKILLEHLPDIPEQRIKSAIAQLIGDKDYRKD